MPTGQPATRSAVTTPAATRNTRTTAPPARRRIARPPPRPLTLPPAPEPHGGGCADSSAGRRRGTRSRGGLVSHRGDPPGAPPGVAAAARLAVRVLRRRDPAV